MSISSYFIRTVTIVSTINIRLGIFSSSSYFDYNGEHRDGKIFIIFIIIPLLLLLFTKILYD
jgi:hypothetical protein